MADATMPVPAQPTLTQVGGGAASAGSQGEDWRARLADLANQPAFKRALPALIGVGALAIVALVYLAIAQGPQRILYAGLSDGERAKVVEALETGGIGYTIDNSTGAITVSESDVYRAPCGAASPASLATNMRAR
ncbi:MAG: flagellar M-ring protein FliF, partial [Pseudomonadota bacterium]